MSTYPGDERAATELHRMRVELEAARRHFRTLADPLAQTLRQRDFVAALERALGEISVVEAVAALQDMIREDADG